MKHISLTLSNQNLRATAIIKDNIAASQELNAPFQDPVDDSKICIKSPQLNTTIMQSESEK